MADIVGMNGESAAGRETRLVLAYDNTNGHLSVDGDLGNVDRILNVLGQAQRYFDAVYRFQQAQIMNAQAAQERQISSLIARPH